MDSIYNALISSNPFVEIFKEVMPLVIASILLYLHYSRRITAMETILFAFATEAYTMLIVGPTFTATFFVSVAFMLDQAHRLFTGRMPIRREYLLLLILPALSSLIIFVLVQVYKDPFYYPPGKKSAFYFRPIYFYIKSFLPLFAVGARIVQEKEQLSFALFSATMKKIAKFSIAIAFLQILVQFVFKSETLDEIVGLQRRYLVEQSASFFSLRVQALFAEPKVYSAFLSLAIPLFVNDREYRWAVLSLIMGVLTISQTFYINLLCAGICCIFLSGMSSVRLRILVSMSIIIGLFLGIAASSKYFIKLYAKNQTNTFYQLVFKRSVYRYDNEIWQKDNVVMGMPLQRDMELPVVDFFKDEPYLLLSGYGAGNSTFIPAQYFFGQVNYENRLNGIGGHNLNMRWFYILAEFGAFALICFFVVLTITRPQLPLFQKGYFAFVWVCFFFSQIDLFLIIVAILCAYDDRELKTTT
ncbi:hypothetical protein [Chitinophaga sp.]|uniref:hypothetical protein n=1 Tax=Chitinophaga sp. TaxID=1869181 RepID=UPI0031D2145F